jgi:hypothetical protein
MKGGCLPVSGKTILSHKFQKIAKKPLSALPTHARRTTHAKSEEAFGCLWRSGLRLFRPSTSRETIGNEVGDPGVLVEGRLFELVTGDEVLFGLEKLVEEDSNRQAICTSGGTSRIQVVLLGLESLQGRVEVAPGPKTPDLAFECVCPIVRWSAVSAGRSGRVFWAWGRADWPLAGSVGYWVSLGCRPLWRLG